MTAVLENINPYSKYGLTRRPTYNEIIGLIGENDKLTGTLPDRTATHYKASQEGSFFDGLDSLEILKEQQHRIMERQMREILMRQNLGGGTYNIARLQQQMREAQSDVEFHSDTNSSAGSRTDASIQAELDEIRRRGVEREQQTGEAHRQGNFLSRNASSMIEGLARRINPQIQRRPAEDSDSSSSQSRRTLEQIPKNLKEGNKKSKARGSNDE